MKRSNWQNSTFGKNYLVSFIFSLISFALILMIPLNLKTINTKKPILKVTLSKVEKQKSKPKIVKFQELPKPQKLTQLKSKAHIVERTKPIPSASNKHPVNEIVQKPNTQNTKKPKKVKINVMEIVESIKTFKALETVGMDFQTKNDKFIYKNIIIPKQNRLVVENKLAKNLNVDNPDSLLVSVTKKSIGFFSALDGPEKTVDSIPYCVLWGRRSFHCPGKSF